MHNKYSLVLFLIMVASSAAAESLERIQYMMGTTARIQVWADSLSQAEAAIDAAFKEMADVDRLMSTYRPESQISLLNRQGATEWIEVDPRFLEVLRASIRFANLTEGAFDPTILPLMYLWGFRGKAPPAIPPPEQLQQTLQHVNYRHILLHPRRNLVRLKQQGVNIDLGGIAKGYALDRAATCLKSQGIRTAALDLGGNLLAFGSQPNTGAGIQDPLVPEGLLGVLNIQNLSLATSGGYERYVRIQNRRYPHILDPRTGQPVDPMLSATAVSSTGIEADALSTALFVLGPCKAVSLVERLGNLEAILAWKDLHGEIHLYVSPGLRRHFIATPSWQTRLTDPLH
ncbi:MAG: FAD:protein FMN transferase [bacterium]|nr:FAD:protein FMN transferase [bacterium]